LKNIYFLLITSIVLNNLHAQQALSIGTDLSILRQLSKHQKFLAVGQTVQANFHFAKKEAAYAWISYYSNGKFKNTLSATSKNSATVPATIKYSVKSRLRYRQISLGWKHFFRGAFDSEENYNLYWLAGFGLLLGKIENVHDRIIDTSTYNKPEQVLAGISNFKRLTFDAALGGEIILAPGFYLYVELRSWFPASDYPSPFLYNNKIPSVILVNGGLRILID
jgi:hypothetical protein